MVLEYVRPVQTGSGAVSTLAAMASQTPRQPERFERVPVNLSSDEIRAMVRDVMG